MLTSAVDEEADLFWRESSPYTNIVRDWAGLSPAIERGADETASANQNNHLSALFRRLTARRGVKRATIAVAHAGCIAYRILKDPVEYRDLRPTLR